jgi:hypothetical protein
MTSVTVSEAGTHQCWQQWRFLAISTDTNHLVPVEIELCTECSNDCNTPAIAIAEHRLNGRQHDQDLDQKADWKHEQNDCSSQLKSTDYYNYKNVDNIQVTQMKSNILPDPVSVAARACEFDLPNRQFRLYRLSYPFLLV